MQDEILALMGLLREFGPKLATTCGYAFAFDPQRKAILLVAGDKSGGSETRFYKNLITKADARFDEHVAKVKSHKRR